MSQKYVWIHKLTSHMHSPALIIRSVPGLQKEELLALFKSFVMPIE